MIPVGWPLALKHPLLVALAALVVSWLFAAWFRRRADEKTARLEADRLRLAGEERETFVSWHQRRQTETSFATTVPVAALTWCVAMGLCLSTGFISFATPSAEPPDAEASIRPLEDARDAALRGDAQAQFEVGSAYEGGLGVEADDQEALRWFLMAANQGHMEAQFYVGQAYSQGFGTKTDLKQAIHWFERAAEQGDPLAQFNLGAMYEHEKPLRDLKKARYWYTVAAEQDYAYAKEALARLGTPTR